MFHSKSHLRYYCRSKVQLNQRIESALLRLKESEWTFVSCVWESDQWWRGGRTVLLNCFIMLNKVVTWFNCGRMKHPLAIHRLNRWESASSDQECLLTPLPPPKKKYRTEILYYLYYTLAHILVHILVSVLDSILVCTPGPVGLRCFNFMFHCCKTNIFLDSHLTANVTKFIYLWTPYFSDITWLMIDSFISN